MKELKEKQVKELTKEEAINTFGGKAIIKEILRDGKIIEVVSKR